MTNAVIRLIAPHVFMKRLVGQGQLSVLSSAFRMAPLKSVAGRNGHDPETPMCLLLDTLAVYMQQCVNHVLHQGAEEDNIATHLVRRAIRQLLAPAPSPPRPSVEHCVIALAAWQVAVRDAHKKTLPPHFGPVCARLISLLNSAEPSMACVSNIALWLDGMVFEEREQVTPFHPPLMRLLLQHWKDPDWKECCARILKTFWLGPYRQDTRLGNELEVCREALQLYWSDHDVMAGTLEVLRSLCNSEAAATEVLLACKGDLLRLLRQYTWSRQVFLTVASLLSNSPSAVNVVPDCQTAEFLCQQCVLFEHAHVATNWAVDGSQYLLARALEAGGPDQVANWKLDQMVLYAPIAYQKMRCLGENELLLAHMVEWYANGTRGFLLGGQGYNIVHWDVTRRAALLVKNWKPPGVAGEQAMVESAARLLAFIMQMRLPKTPAEFAAISLFTVDELVKLPGDHPATMYAAIASRVHEPLPFYLRPQLFSAPTLATFRPMVSAGASCAD